MDLILGIVTTLLKIQAPHLDPQTALMVYGVAAFLLAMLLHELAVKMINRWFSNSAEGVRRGKRGRSVLALSLPRAGKCRASFVLPMLLGSCIIARLNKMQEECAESSKPGGLLFTPIAGAENNSGKPEHVVSRNQSWKIPAAGKDFPEIIRVAIFRRLPMP